MTTNISSTVVSISDVAKRVADAIDEAVSKISDERVRRIKEVKRHADDLTTRGLLKRPEYPNSSPADFEKLYLSRRG